jgi:hypothetical protein
MMRHGLQVNKWQLIKEDPEIKDILVNRNNGNLKDRWRNKIFDDLRAELEVAAQQASAAAQVAATAARAAREAAHAKAYAEATRRAAVGVFHRAASAFSTGSAQARGAAAAPSLTLQELTFTLQEPVKGLILSVLEAPENRAPQTPWGIVIKTILAGGSGERVGLLEGDVIKSAGGVLLQRLPHETEVASVAPSRPPMLIPPCQKLLLGLRSLCSGS